MVTLPIHDPLLIFAIVMLNVLVAPILAEKLRLPAILGLILSGVIFGPHLFGIIERDRTIELFGSIGILYIMFQAGLEINLSEVKKNKSHSLGFGFLTFIIPLFLGYFSGVFLLHMTPLQAILFASMFSSHTLLTFPIVSKLGLSKRTEVSTSIGGTIITDTLALLILAVVIKMYSGNIDSSFWIKLIISMTIYTLFIIFIFPKITRWFFRKYSNENGIEEYVFIFTSLFAISYLAHFAGLEPIIGAFLVGLSLNRLIPEKSVLMNRIHFVGESLFIPYFLISVGMIIEPKAFISDFETWKVSIIMGACVLISKYLSAEIFGYFAKYEKEQRRLVFGLTVNQAAATLAAVLIGYEIGIFNESVLSGTIFMIILSTFVGAFQTNSAVKIILSKVQKTSKNKNTFINDRLLLSVSNPKNISFLSDLAFYVSKEENHAIYPLNIVNDDESLEHNLEKSEELLTKVIMKAVEANKNVTPLTKIDKNISEAIGKTCKEYRISKVIIGWSKKSRIFRNIFESNYAENYIKNSKEMVLVAKIIEKIEVSRNTILVVPPFITLQKGFSDAFKVVLHLAKDLNDKLIVISDQETIEDIMKLNFSKKQEMKCIALKSFKRITEEIEKIISPNDLIVQMCARNWEISWRLDFEKLSYSLPVDFKNHSFIGLYPYSFDEEDKETTQIFIKDEFFKSIEPQDLVISEKESNLKEVIIKYNHENPSEFSILLEDLLKEKHIELSHDVALIHSHNSNIESPKIVLVLSKNRVSVGEYSKDYKLIILLLSPKEMELKEHLGILAEIAKFTKNNRKLELLYGAKNYADFINKINNEKI